MLGICTYIELKIEIELEIELELKLKLEIELIYWQKRYRNQSSKNLRFLKSLTVTNGLPLL